MRLIFTWGPKPLLKSLDSSDSDEKSILDKLALYKTVELETLVYNASHFQKFDDEWVIVTSAHYIGYIGTISNIATIGNRTTLEYTPTGKVFIWHRYLDEKSGIKFAHLTQYKKL